MEKNQIVSTPVTTAVAAVASPGLLRSEVDSRITKIRPSATPLDQISRMVGCRVARSMKVDYYSVDTRPGHTEVAADYTASTVSTGEEVKIKVRDPSIFAKTDTLMFPSLATPDGTPLMFYVQGIEGKTLSLLCVNLDEAGKTVVMGALSAGDTVVRMGRAADELDVQTATYTALPNKKSNYCQIFKAQVEESVLQRLADKEVGWSFNDQEEVAIMDMRMSMEKSFLFGVCSRMDVPGTNEQRYFTGGIWSQAGAEFAYSPSAFTGDTVIELMRKAFTGSGGSTRKVLLAGSGLIERLNKLEMARTVREESERMVWGINFSRMVSKFGSLHVHLCEVFDLCGMPDAGIVIDPAYLTKYSHIPFSAERISFRRNGTRNTEGVVLTEASCLVLRHPKAHMRIVAAD